MSGNIDTREFSITDYDAAVELWQRVEGLEIAEGDSRLRFPFHRAACSATRREETSAGGSVEIANGALALTAVSVNVPPRHGREIFTSEAKMGGR
jgi:hypothetical protein